MSNFEEKIEKLENKNSSLWEKNATKIIQKLLKLVNSQDRITFLSESLKNFREGKKELKNWELLKVSKKLVKWENEAKKLEKENEESIKKYPQEEKFVKLLSKSNQLSPEIVKKILEKKTPEKYWLKNSKKNRGKQNGK